MKKIGMILLIICIFFGYSGGMIVNSFDALIDDHIFLISNQEQLSNYSSIPSWTIADTWIYEGDVYFVGDNMTFDGVVSNVAQTVIEIGNLTSNDTLPFYALEINGNINGLISYEWLSGDLQGIINGWMHVRMSDLAIIEIQIWSNGTIDVWPLIFDYGFYSHTGFSPPLENYDFPIILNETWDIFSNISGDVIFNIGDIINENFSESGTLNEMMVCDTKDNVTVPGGIFETFQIDVYGNETLTYWFSPLVKNSIKTFINYTSENSTLDLQLNLTSHSLTNQLLNTTQYLIPSSVYANDIFTVRGQVFEHSSSTPVSDASVIIRVPYTNDVFVTTTDSAGNYSFSLVAPLINDSTSTTVDFGSDGIIVFASSGNMSGYIIRTLTVKGLQHTFLFSPGWNLITVPTDSNWTAETMGENFTSSSVISKFNGETQVFTTHVVGTPWNDFPIESGTGYFVFIMNSSTFTVRDMPIGSVCVPIFEGWNILGWYHCYNITAEDLGNSITNCTLVIMFNESSQIFITHVVGTPWNNFSLQQGLGFFIWSNAQGCWEGRL